MTQQFKFGDRVRDTALGLGREAIDVAMAHIESKR